MIPTLRTIALLMLLAGVSLGVFAGTLLADREEPPAATLEQKIEERLKLYRDLYDLNADEESRIRQTLRWQRRKVYDTLRRLYEENQEQFTEINDEAQRRLDAILAEKPGGAPTEEGDG